MSKLIPFLALAVLCAVGTTAVPVHAASPGVPAKKAGMASAILKIAGMHCEGCASGVTSKLSSLKGVKSAKVDFKTGKGTVSYDAAACKPAQLIEAVKKAGYEATIVP